MCFVCVRLAFADWREESLGDVRQQREKEHRNNGVRESTSEEDEKSKPVDTARSVSIMYDFNPLFGQSRAEEQVSLKSGGA